jgi:hypothetical protein
VTRALVGPVVAVEHDLLDQNMGDALLGSGVRAWCIPGCWQIPGKRHQRGAVDLGSKHRGDIVLSDAILQMRDALQSGVPAALELARQRTLGRVDDLVAAGG